MREDWEESIAGLSKLNPWRPDSGVQAGIGGTIGQRYTSEHGQFGGPDSASDKKNQWKKGGLDAGTSNKKAHLSQGDYDTIVTWLENPVNRGMLWGEEGKTSIGNSHVTATVGYKKLAEQVNLASKGRLMINRKAMRERFKTYKQRYTKTKALLDTTGFDLDEADRAKGIHTIERKVETLCPFFYRMDKLFGSRANIEPHFEYDQGIEGTSGGQLHRSLDEDTPILPGIEVEAEPLEKNQEGTQQGFNLHSHEDDTAGDFASFTSMLNDDHEVMDLDCLPDDDVTIGASVHLGDTELQGLKVGGKRKSLPSPTTSSSHKAKTDVGKVDSRSAPAKLHAGPSARDIKNTNSFAYTFHLAAKAKAQMRHATESEKLAWEKERFQVQQAAIKEERDSQLAAQREERLLKLEIAKEENKTRLEMKRMELWKLVLDAKLDRKEMKDIFHKLENNFGTDNNQ